MDQVFAYCQNNVTVLQCPSQQTLWPTNSSGTRIFTMAAPYKTPKYTPGYGMSRHAGTSYLSNSVYRLVGIPLSRVVNPAKKIWFADAGWLRWATGSPNADKEGFTSNIESRGAS